MSVTIEIPNVTRQLGEGPHWEDSTGTLVFIDSLEKQLFKWNPVIKDISSVKLDGTIGSVVPCRNGGYLVGLGRTISHFDWETGTTTKLHEVDSNGFDDRFNDGKCDPAGRFWTGTMGGQIDDTPSFEPNVGSLYSLDTNGKLVKHYNNISVSNGLAWSSDEQTMFYIDTGTRKVQAFTYDVTSGELSERRDVVNFHDLPDEIGWPDGMTIDTDGHLWVACFFSGKVICFDPNTGKKLREITFPSLRTTSCCFGGENLDELYVTSATMGAKEEELKGYPSTGSVFKVTGLGVKGRPANVYLGATTSKI